MSTPATPAPLTTTSYAILGLLAVKPWTTYELAQQMRRALGQFWPRAESKLYEEPKKLVAHGLARATKETTGKRPRTVYSITAKGRRAMAAWVPQPGAGPGARVRGARQAVLRRARHQARHPGDARPRPRVERRPAPRQRRDLRGRTSTARAPSPSACPGSCSAASSSRSSTSWWSAGPSGPRASSRRGPTTSPAPCPRSTSSKPKRDAPRRRPTRTLPAPRNDARPRPVHR